MCRPNSVGWEFGEGAHGADYFALFICQHPNIAEEVEFALISALLLSGPREWSLAMLLGFIAVAMATINVMGGFLVTNRMVQMLQKDGPTHD